MSKCLMLMCQVLLALLALPFLINLMALLLSCAMLILGLQPNAPVCNFAHIKGFDAASPLIDSLSVELAVFDFCLLEFATVHPHPIVIA